MKKSGIYIITCLADNKVYIGSSVDVYSRWKRHRYDLKNNQHENQHLQNAYNKFGKEMFIFHLLEECKKTELVSREQHYLDTYKSWDKTNGFNKYQRAYSPKGWKMSDTQKRKISLALTGHLTSKETRDKIGKAHKGKKMSKEAIEANRRWHTGRKQSEDNIAKRAREYSFIDKEGNIFKGRNLKRFAEKHKLHRGDLRDVLNGKRNTHRGLKKYKGD